MLNSIRKSMDITGKMIGIFCLFGSWCFSRISYICKIRSDSGYKANKHFLKKLYHTSYLKCLRMDRDVESEIKYRFK